MIQLWDPNWRAKSKSNPSIIQSVQLFYTDVVQHEKESRAKVNPGSLGFVNLIKLMSGIWQNTHL